ncbi:hypothetical protein C2S52_012986, partial [Perilla frutescens var. hirtella]
MFPFGNIILFSTIIFLSHLVHVSSQDPDYPSANLSTAWINNASAKNSVTFNDNSIIRPILLNGNNGPIWGCGFYCNGNCNNIYMFAIFIINLNDSGLIVPDAKFLQIVWSANRNNPVGINAALQLTAEGDLVLSDADGALAWSTNTSGKAIVGLNLTRTGNLVLFDAKDVVVWQSFDHPSDCLLPGQKLVSGKNLTASASSSNWTNEGSVYSLLMTDVGLVAYILSNPPLVYYEKVLSSGKKNREASYAKFQDEVSPISSNGALELYINGVEPDDYPDLSIPIPGFAVAQYIKLGADGHLRVFEWDDDAWLWKEAADIFTNTSTGYLDDCDYPMACGEYGVCSNGQCGCPGGGSFRQIDGRRPNLGCSEVVPLSCDDIEKHNFLDLDNATYFSFVADINNTDVDSCKEACLKNCSCKAAIFRHGLSSSNGSCFLPSQIFSLRSNERDGSSSSYNASVSIKMQIAPKGKSSLLWPILGSILIVVCVFVVVGTVVFVYQRKERSEDVEEDYLDHIPGMPTRFSYEELETATENFKTQLGRGGFGSVFEGLLSDGTRIAVKCLDGVGQIRKSFLAEVETIGSIHHINLVRLIGFCAEKSHRLLVYEYMCNGSLDKWIYCRSNETPLDWSHRRNIILDIAKGLSYLHEDCRQKIIHLDIKPQNILLDENHNAKLADFGLSKLIDRNQREVVTNVKGTPGYLAPEWLSGVITEKVDVYSFGVVILQIISGRNIFEESKPEEERYLLSVFKQKAEEGEWLDLADKCCQNVESNVAEIEKIMRISAWCLQHYEKRPTMSMVIKVLEGAND